MKRFWDVSGYMLGGFVNIALAALTVLFVYKALFWGMAYGKELINAETTTKAPLAVTVTIPEGADAMEIGGILQDEGLVSNRFVFYLQARLNGTYKLFNAGEYDLNMAMSSGDIMETLQKVQSKEKGHLTITIAEGLNVKQIGALAESLDLFTEGDFVEACDDFDVRGYGFLEAMPRRDNLLEGYLFPDTYYLPENPEPEDLIVRMLNRFDDVIFEYEPLIEQSGMTMDEIVTVASLIEKEIRRADERPLAASVIYNRLNIGMRLQIDATVVYVLDKRRDRLTDADLLTDSPYNTYVSDGLPKGPIASPGKASIEAAINPAATSYLYYVVRDEDTGEHYFTADYDDFLRAKSEYLNKKDNE